MRLQHIYWLNGLGDTMDDPYIRLYDYLCAKIGGLFALLATITARGPELQEKLAFINEELIHLSDHTKHELEDLKPSDSIAPAENPITQKLYDEAFEECLKNRDFS